MNSPATINEQTLLEATWAAFRAQIVAGNQQLVLPDNLPSSVVSIIASRYSDVINGPVSTTAVPKLNIIRLTPFMASTPLTTTPSVVSTASPGSLSDFVEPKVGKAKVRRPANAFILYRQSYHPVIKEQYPGIANNDISKKVATMWKYEKDDVKAAWKAKANEVKEQHMRDHPDYSYQPRKPSEKKRRMTKRKAAALQAQTASFAPVEPEQPSMSAQLPLLSFTVTADDSTLMEFPVVQNGHGLDALSQILDQQNDTQLNSQHNPAALAVNGTNFNISGAIVPDAPLGNYDASFALASGGNINPFIGIGSHTAEQERQQMLVREVVDWDAFLRDYSSTV